MLAASHRLTAAAAYVAYSTWAEPQPLAHVAIGALVATATSAGWSSPDVDQAKPIVVLGRALGPLGRLVAHRRGVTHWWFVPVALWLWWLPALDSTLAWAATALLIGWASHIVGDFVFGRVPILPGWGPMVGLGLDTGGWLEEGWSWFPLSPLRTALAAGIGVLLWSGVTLGG